MARADAANGLNDMQRRFCDEYRKDLCIKQAAIRAGYSAKSAASQGSELFKNPNVRAHIDEMLAQDSLRTGISVDRVIRELARVALADPTQIIDPRTAEIREDASPDDRAAIQSVRVKVLPAIVEDGEPGIEREVKFYDKLKALEQLGRHIGMYGLGDKASVERAKLKIDKERLELERIKAGQGNEDTKDTGVVVMPPVTPEAPQ